MKCDKLKVYVPQDGPWGLEPEEGGKLVEEETCYLKSEVDAAIAELKAKLHDAKMAKDLAEAANTEYREDIKKLKEELVLGKEAYTRARNEKMAMFDELSKIKFENEMLKELKDKYSSCAEKAINSIAKCELKIRSLSRALYKACANWAHHRVFVRFNTNEKAWEKMERKCFKKAKEYE